MKVATTHNDQFLLEGMVLDRETMLDIAAFPGHTKWKGRGLIVRPTGANIEHLLGVFPGAEFNDTAQALVDHYKAKKTQAKALEQAKNEALKDKDFNFKTIPYEHQEKAFVLQRDAEVFALLMDMGTGKTKVAIDTAAYQYQKKAVDTIIIVAWPSGVHQVWVEDEFPIHCPCPWSGWAWDGNAGKKKTQQFIHKTVEQDVLKVFTFNIEAFRSEKARTWVDMILSQSMEGAMLVVDESIAIKNPSAKQTQYLTKLGKDRKVKFKRILTGAQVSNSNADVFAQYRFLDPQIIGYDTYTSFKSEFCVLRKTPGSKFGEFIVGYKNLDKLIASINPYSFRVRKEECLTLPPKVYRSYPFSLSKKEQRLHDELKEEFCTQLDQEEITAELALVRLTRLQQISSGWFPSEDEFRLIEEQPSRLKALLEIIAENKGKKCIVWSRFVADVELITKTLGGSAVAYYGKTSSEQRSEARNRFQNDPTCMFFVAQFQTASRGLTLTAADFAVYYTNQYSLDMRVQSEDRCHRIDEARMSKRSSVPYIDLCARGTGDSKIIEALRKKKDIADVVNLDPRASFLQYGNGNP